VVLWGRRGRCVFFLLDFWGGKDTIRKVKFRSWSDRCDTIMRISLNFTSRYRYVQIVRFEILTILKG
jgi:hypothetical protein